MSTIEPPATRYPDLKAACRDLSLQMAKALESAISARGRAGLIVSGGKSPIALFEALRRQSLDWSLVHVGLADERWVDPSDAASNEKLVRDHLLADSAAAAQFTGLKTAAATPDLGAADAWRALAHVPRPYDVVVLGMGDDGHTASLFPNSPNLAAAIDTAATPACIGMRSPTAPHARLSLNASALLDSRRIVLFLNGAEKWRVYTAASLPGPVGDMPVRTILRQSRTPFEVIWSP